MFTSRKHFQKHHDGFGEARNTFNDVGYMQFWDGEPWAVPLPSAAQWESPVRVSDTLAES